MAEPMTDERLAEIKRLAEKATAGPWWKERTRPEDDQGRGHHLCLIKYPWSDVPTWLAESSTHPNRESDFDFIAAARDAVPQLVAEVERLRAENAEQEKELDRLRANAGYGGDAADAPEELWLLSSMPNSCDSWLHIGRAFVEDGKLTPEMQERVDAGLLSAPVRYVRADRLQQTADGVPVVPGMTLYGIYAGHEKDQYSKGSGTVQSWKYEPQLCSWATYSTRAAAEAAAKGGGDEGKEKA